jgi:hypothetical protein
LVGQGGFPELRREHHRPVTGAGNAIGRAFEVDEAKPIDKRIETQTVSIPFTVAP